jgi:signal transduction histidine kinase
MLALGAAAYLLWVNATVLDEGTDPVVDDWYERLAAAELDSLARSVGPELSKPARAETHLVRFGEHATAFGAEVVITDLAGRALFSSQPDSLTAAVGAVDTALLKKMMLPDWDWSSYPVPEDIDAYPNRIFEVDRLYAGPDSTAAPLGFLVASFRPVVVDYAELITDYRRLQLQALAVALVVAALSGLFVMGWLSRRIEQLSRGVEAFAAGDLNRRVPARSPDELGRLGRRFNEMGERLATLVAELQQKESFQRQLIANISHDLRTPMTSLRGYVDILSNPKAPLPGRERARYLEIIAANLDHLDKLVEQLLQLSRLDAGQAEFQPEDFPLPELVDDVIALYAMSARERRISLRAEMAADVPLVRADPLQITQVLQNLVSNGIKFTDPGGEVRVHLEASDGWMTVTVSDTGQGIKSDDLPHVFDRFFTGDRSRSRKGESNGLGLAISQRILAGHGSELTVRSEPERGSVFAFRLPLAAVTDALSAEA